VAFEVQDGALYITGYKLPGSRKYKNIAAGNERVAVIVDDLASVQPWRPRGIRIYGTAAPMERNGRPYLQVTPEISWSWNLERPAFVDGRFVPHRTVHRAAGGSKHQKGRIRPIALAVVVDAGRLLVTEFHRPQTGDVFYRSLGGTIEFGETGDQALRRELREELGAEVTEPEFLFVMDNIFSEQGVQAHELVLFYRVEFLNPRFTRQDEWLAYEDNGETLLVRWAKPDIFHPQRSPLYPEGLLERLQERGILQEQDGM
jgi:ADP-ribose pyrophosphatase YjhB (NUDIX family)